MSGGLFRWSSRYVYRFSAHCLIPPSLTLVRYASSRYPSTAAISQYVLLFDHVRPLAPAFPIITDTASASFFLLWNTRVVPLPSFGAHTPVYIDYILVQFIHNAGCVAIRTSSSGSPFSRVSICCREWRRHVRSRRCATSTMAGTRRSRSCQWDDMTAVRVLSASCWLRPNCSDLVAGIFALSQGCSSSCLLRLCPQTGSWDVGRACGPRKAISKNSTVARYRRTAPWPDRVQRLARPGQHW